jgi:hypothetical protein
LDIRPRCGRNGRFVLCTNAGTAAGANTPTGAFSGAAVATQALTELTQTTTQETVRNTESSVADRREQEKQRCAEGFSRVDGICQPNPPQVSEAAPVAPAGPPEEHALKKTKKTKAATVSRKEAVAPAPKIVRRAPPTPPVFAPVPVEPAVRIGAWTQLYGDYEKRNAQGSTNVTASNFGAPTVPSAPFPLPLSVETHSGTVGFLFGADGTSRGVLSPDDGLIAGLLLGYLSSNVTVNTSSGPGRTLGLSLVNNTMDVGTAQLNANLTGLTTGAYATYFNGAFSTDFVLKVDALSLNENFNNLLSFTNPQANNPQANNPDLPPISSSFSGAGTFSMTNTTLGDNLNYRFILHPNFWIEPTVGAQYTHSQYGANAADFGLADGDLVMVQGGARFGASTLINNHILMTTTLTGLAYDDVLVSGGFIPGAAFLANNLLAQADQGQVRGRGILALNFDFGQGITSFVQGEARGGKGLFGAGGKAGVRVQW